MERSFTTLRAALSATALVGLLALAPSVAAAQAGPSAATSLPAATTAGSDRALVELAQGNRYGWRSRTLRRHYSGPRRGYRSPSYGSYRGYRGPRYGSYRAYSGPRYGGYRSYGGPRYRYGSRYRSPGWYYGFGPALIIGGSLALSKSRHSDRWQRCDDRYRSFRWSDGTFQPYGDGPRQLCPYLRR